jgi:type III secretion system low calcium response chaperone LcrH/SycD
MLRELLQKIADGRDGESLFPEDLDSFLEDFVPNVLLKNETLQRAFSITDQEMRELYKLAYKHYQAKNYSLAFEHYRFFVILNPFETSYWMGYGACLQLLKQPEKALAAYATCTLLDEYDPICHYHAYECYMAMDNAEEARKALALAYEICGHEQKHLALKNHIKMLDDKLLV